VRATYQRALAKQPTIAAMRYDVDSLRLLVALCRDLQQEAKDQPFYLACRTAGELIGTSYKLAASWLRMLVADGALKVVKLSTPRQAIRYRYLAD
jgi:hypothetical protein